LTFERTLMRLVALATARDGTLDAGDVEHDELARNAPDERGGADARRRRGREGSAGSDGWFPFQWLSLTESRRRRSRQSGSKRVDESFTVTTSRRL